MISEILLLVLQRARLQRRNIMTVTDPDEQTPMCEEDMVVFKAVGVLAKL